MSRLSHVASAARYYGSLLNPEFLRLRNMAPSKAEFPAEKHLGAAVDWLRAAQDAFGGGGVARSYSLVYKPFFGKRGWTPPYPETTGYIIPTLFDYAALTGDSDARGRAVRMADWECEVQMESGAVQGGTIGAPRPSPAIFNTGQVIFGWVRAHRETGEKRYLDSALRAGEYLVSQQDQDGAWRKNLSEFATDRINTYTYNTRSAWALLQLSEASGDNAFREAAARNIEYALTQQLPNGWFENNCLFNPAAPLMHTIAYCVRGILEAGVMLDEKRYIDAAALSAGSIMGVQAPDGSFPARLDRDWRAGADYSCLTGNAQAGVIFGRLFELTGETRYADALRKANRFLRSVQILDESSPHLHGGITGSYPIGGRYGSYEILNWAVKFFIDSLMKEREISG